MRNMTLVCSEAEIPAYPEPDTSVGIHRDKKE